LRGLGHFISFFDMLCKIVYSIGWAKNNKWALPSGAKEQIGRSRAPLIFFAHSIENKKSRPKPRKYENTPGQPIPEFRAKQIYNLKFSSYFTDSKNI